MKTFEDWWDIIESEASGHVPEADMETFRDVAANAWFAGQAELLAEARAARRRAKKRRRPKRVDVRCVDVADLVPKSLAAANKENN
jgi:hypothetical protein